MTEALKYDEDKVPLELLAPTALTEIAKVLQFGAKKYSAHNWRKGMKWSRLLGASLRHLFAYIRGEDKDPETGLSHLAHLGCCVMFLLEYQLLGLGTDDRYGSQPPLAEPDKPETPAQECPPGCAQSEFDWSGGSGRCYTFRQYTDYVIPEVNLPRAVMDHSGYVRVLENTTTTQRDSQIVSADGKALSSVAARFYKDE